MQDVKKWDWTIGEKTIQLDEWKDAYAWVEEYQVSPDGEKVGAIVRVDEETSGICINGDLQESTFEKIWHLRFSPNGAAVAFAADMDEWTLVSDDVAWENTFDYVWNILFSHDGNVTAMAFQKEGEYGMAVNDEIWETTFENISGMILNPEGTTTAAVVQVNSFSEGEIDNYQKGIYTVCTNGVVWDGVYTNVWDIAVNDKGDISAATIRTGLYDYTIAVNNKPWTHTYPCVWEPDLNPVTGAICAPVKAKEGWTICENDQLIWDGRYKQLWNIQHSPDGKTIAAVGSTKYGTWTAVVNDTPWHTIFDEYVGDLTMSPDGRKIAVRGKNQGRWQVALDGTFHGPVVDRLWKPVFSADGGHLACKVELNNRYTLVIDGKPMKESYDMVWDPIFSPCSGFVLLRAVKNGAYIRKVMPV